MKLRLCLVLACVAGLFVTNANAQTDEQKVQLYNEGTINSSELEFSPAFLEDGIVFITSKVASNRYKVKDKNIDYHVFKIFRAQREQESGLLLPPAPLAAEFLSSVHEGPLTFDKTGTKVYFTRNNLKDGRPYKSKKDRIIKMKIYEAEKEGDKWGGIKELAFNSDDYSCVHPSISVDNQYLYFSSDMPGGQGGMDLYYVKLVGGEWSEPVNMGPGINTPGDEVFPFIHADGSLFYATDGNGGEGGLDIFTTLRTKEGFAKPVNMGKPFNSPADDFGLILDLDKRNGYLSSNRLGGQGADDIYSFYIREPLDLLASKDAFKPRDVKVKVIDALTRELLPESRVAVINLGEVALSQALSNMSAGYGSQNDNLSIRLDLQPDAGTLTDEFGYTTVKLTSVNSVLYVTKAGYAPLQYPVTVHPELNEVLVEMRPPTDLAERGGDVTIGAGTTFELPNIYYNFNDAGIRQDARTDLDALVAFMKQYPDVRIELGSHTDSRGTYAYNIDLSQRRAQNAARYLEQHGIEKNRVIPVGYGESYLRNRCTDGIDCEELEHQFNRRTEVKIVGIDKPINVRITGPATEIFDAPAPKEEFTSKGGASAKAGQYRVIAGVYSNKANAEKKLGQLADLGYPTARIEGLDQQGRHYIVVETFNSDNDAQVLVKNLIAAQVRAFVKK